MPGARLLSCTRIKKDMDKNDTKNLKKRYLVWFYKSAKEAFDKVERKFTQAEIDRIILREFKARDKKGTISNFIKDFENYIVKKEQEGLSLKFKDRKLSADYEFLLLRLKAVEKVIIKELGKNTLKDIKRFYESEMTARILRSTEH